MGFWQQQTKARLAWWLRRGEGEAVRETIARVLAAFTQRAYDGLLARFPTYAPDDALPLIGRDRRVVRGINEPRASYVARLLRFLDTLQWVGNAFAMHDELRAYLQADVMIRTVSSRGTWMTTAVGGARSWSLGLLNWDWDGDPVTQWSRFWVVIYPVAGVPWSASVAGAWPAGGTIGTSATPDQVATVRAIIAERKPAGTTCEWIVVAYDDETYGPATPTANGDQRNNGYDAGAGAYAVARNLTARYWRGKQGA